MMITVEEALQQVLAHSRVNPPGRVRLSDSCGLTLAGDVASDLDSPPYDKAMVDGYALVAGDLAGGVAELKVLEEVTAGVVPTQPVTTGHATRIMTGAVLPDGADAVVMIERTNIINSGKNQPEIVRIEDEPPPVGKNVMRQATVMRRGETILSAGTEIRPVDIGLLAEVGRGEVTAFARPSAAVLSTGNELVPAGRMPEAGQIRNSNGPMLLAAVERAGGTPIDLGIGRDDPTELRRLVESGLSADVLIISGGVSAGVLDLVPGVLEDSGVEKVFHKVRLKPGKPLWFGVLSGDSRETLVFGLPGNPVSGLVCFELFVRPAIQKLSGKAGHQPRHVAARLSADHRQHGNRPTYHPGRLHTDQRGAVVDPLPWLGSADLKGLAAADALIVFPAGDHAFQSGDTVDVVPWA